MKEYNSIHELYYIYHKNHGTDHLLKRVESAEEAKRFFKQYGMDLQRASEWIRKYGKDHSPFPSWKRDPRFWIAFLVFLGSTVVMFKTNAIFSSTIMMFSSMAAFYPICYKISGCEISKKLLKTSRRFQDDRLFKRQKDQKIIRETNYFIAKQNKVWEENQISGKDERIPNWLECIWLR